MKQLYFQTLKFFFGFLFVVVVVVVVLVVMNNYEHAASSYLCIFADDFSFSIILQIEIKAIFFKRNLKSKRFGIFFILFRCISLFLPLSLETSEMSNEFILSIAIHSENLIKNQFDV